MRGQIRAKDKASTKAHTDVAVARRNEIVMLAAELFNTHGVDRVSMVDIADAAGLAKPSLYHYFSSKEEILYTIHINLFDRLLGKLEERLASDLPPDQQLLGVFQDQFETLETHPGHIRVFFEHFRRLEPEYRSAVRASQRKYERLVEGILEEGAEKGYFRDVDIKIAMLGLFGMVNWAHYWYSPTGPYKPAELAEKFYKLFVLGVGAKNPPSH